MIGYIKSNGYDVQYLDETLDSVRVVISKGDERYEETAKSSEQILQNSKAIKFAKQNKLRFHAVRKIASFHLPHLFMGCGDDFTSEFRDWDEGQSVKITDKDGNTVVNMDEGIVEYLETFEGDSEELEAFFLKNKNKIIKNVALTSLYGKTKARIEDA